MLAFLRVLLEAPSPTKCRLTLKREVEGAVPYEMLVNAKNGTAPPTSRFLFFTVCLTENGKAKNKKSPLNKGRLFGFCDFKLRAVDFYSAFYYR